MHCAISTYTLFSKSIDEAIRMLIYDGWKHIEIMGEGTHHGRMLLQMDASQLNKLAQLGRENGVTFGYHLPIEGFNPANPFEDTYELWKKCKTIIELFDMKYILFHPGENPSSKEGLHNTATFAKNVLQDLPDNVFLLIENVPRANDRIGSSIEQLVQIIIKTDDKRLKIMLDTGHCYMNDKDNFLKECQKAYPYLFGLHVNDNHGLTDEHLQIGEGTIPFHDLFQSLPRKELTMVLETNTVQRALNSKQQIEQFVKTNWGN